jgi:hypothetical protein
VTFTGDFQMGDDLWAAGFFYFKTFFDPHKPYDIQEFIEGLKRFDMLK